MIKALKRTSKQIVSSQREGGRCESFMNNCRTRLGAAARNKRSRVLPSQRHEVAFRKYDGHELGGTATSFALSNFMLGAFYFIVGVGIPVPAVRICDPGGLISPRKTLALR